MDKIEADLRESKSQQKSLRKAYESVRDQASSLIIFSVQWGDLEDHFESTRESIESRFRELERRERAVESKERSFQSEKEAKSGELDRLNDLVDQRLKEVSATKNRLIALQGLIREHSDEVAVQERRLEAVEEFVRGKENECESVEERLKEGTKKLNSVEERVEEKEESLSKLVEEVELREKELNETLWLVEVHKKEIQEGDKKLGSVWKSVEECSKTMREFDEKERDFGLLMKTMEAWSCELAFRERELEVKQKQVGEEQESVQDCENRLDVKRRELQDKATELALKEEELESVKKSTEEHGQIVKYKERELEDQLKAVDLWKKELDLTERSTEEQTRILKVKEKEIEVQANELELKLNEFDSTKKSMEEMTRNLKLQEGRLGDQARELELKQKEFDSVKKTRNLKARENTTSVVHSRVKIEQLGYTPSNNAVVPSCTSKQSSSNRDGRGLQMFMNEHLKRIDVVGHEVSAVLQASSDPAKLVLDAMEGFYPPKSSVDSRECDFDLGVIRRSCIVLLESLTRVTPQINPQVRQEAIKLSGEWKAKMTTDSENWLEILGFLRLVHAYKITSAYDAEELRSLIAKVGENEQATELSRSLGTTDMSSASIICSPVKIEKPQYAAIVSSPSIQQTAKDAANVSSPNLHQCATKDTAIVSSTNLEQTLAKDAATVSSLNLQQTYAKDAATVSSLNLQQTYAKDAATVSSLYVQQTAVKVAATVSSQNLQQTASKVAAIASSSNLQQNATTGERNLQGFLNELSKGNHLKQDETLAALQRSSDPAKFVLDLMQSSFIEYWGNEDVRSKGIVMLSYINVMEQLMGVLPHCGLHVKSDALKLAHKWKENMGADTRHPLEPVGLLQFLATYGLISDYPRAHTSMLLQTFSQQKQSQELRPALAFADKIPAQYIQNFIEKKQVVTAVRFICSFQLIGTFPPVPLLKELVVTRMNFFKTLCKAKKSLDEKDKLLDAEIRELRDVIRCIKDCNLESEYPLRNIEKQIVVLENIKVAHRRSKASRACKLELEQEDSLASEVEQQEQNGSADSPASNFVQQQQKQTNGRKRRWNPPAPQQHHQKKFKRRPYPQPTYTPEYPPGSHSSWLDENYSYPGPAGQFDIPADDYEAGAIPSSGLYNSYRQPRYGGLYHA